LTSGSFRIVSDTLVSITISLYIVGHCTDCTIAALLNKVAQIAVFI